jgi:hypothetical protein
VPVYAPLTTLVDNSSEVVKAALAEVVLDLPVSPIVAKISRGERTALVVVIFAYVALVSWQK